MSSALFADISVDQVVSDMAAYAGWSRQFDGFARLMCKATEGVGYKDASFERFWSEALANDVSTMMCYHYARPDLNPGTTGAANEARWFAQVIGNRLRAHDILMLDFEQNESNTWAHAFHDALAATLPLSTKPVLYDSASRFQQYFAGDLELSAKYDVALAAWHELEQGPPPVPQGWTMAWWQWTDNTAPRPIMGVPGISMPVDLNVWYGGTPMAVPSGWTDDEASETLTAPNGQVVRWGFRKWVLSHPWDGSDQPYGPEYAYTWDGKGAGSRQDFASSSLGYTDSAGIFLAWLGVELHAAQAEIAQLKSQPPTQTDPKATAAKAALQAWLAE